MTWYWISAYEDLGRAWQMYRRTHDCYTRLHFSAQTNYFSFSKTAIELQAYEQNFVLSWTIYFASIWFRDLAVKAAALAGGAGSINDMRKMLVMNGYLAWLRPGGGRCLCKLNSFITPH